MFRDFQFLSLFTWATSCVTIFSKSAWPWTISPAIGWSRIVAPSRSRSGPYTTRLGAARPAGPWSPPTINCKENKVKVKYIYKSRNNLESRNNIYFTFVVTPYSCPFMSSTIVSWIMRTVIETSFCTRAFQVIQGKIDLNPSKVWAGCCFCSMMV